MNRRRFLSISALGFVTIAAYGTWFYSFGVLLDPIILDTGWSESSLTAAFAVGLASGGAASIPAGRALDRFGSRPMFVIAGLVSTVGLWLGSNATSVMAFGIFTAIASAVLASLAFYHITQPTSVRVAPDQPARAISILTIYGAVASTIYLPAAAFLVGRYGWRPTIQIMASVTGLILIGAAAVVSEEERPKRDPLAPGLGVALADPHVRRFVIAWSTMGLAVGIVLVYQVPLMTDAGLPLATASALAGARGAAQILGRIPMTAMVRRIGSRRSLRLAYGFTIVGLGLLAVSSSVLIGAAYALVAGFGIGAASPLAGIYADEVFDRNRLGMFMGFLGAVGAIAVAAGPALAGVIADLTGTRSWSVVLATVAAVSAFFLLRSPIESPTTLHGLGSSVAE